jgi:hypothetical protein
MRLSCLEPNERLDSWHLKRCGSAPVVYERLTNKQREAFRHSNEKQLRRDLFMDLLHFELFELVCDGTYYT